MSYQVVTIDGDFNGTGSVTLISGPSSGHREVHYLEVYNADDVTHTVRLSATISGSSRLRKTIKLRPGASYVWTPKVALTDGMSITGVLLAADSPHVNFLVTYAEVSG